MYLSNLLALLHRFMIVSEVVYNIHLCKVCQCFIPVCGGAIPLRSTFGLICEETTTLHKYKEINNTEYPFSGDSLENQ